MSYQKLDSEVLKIVTRILKDMADDESIGEFGRENSKNILDMIGRTYVSVAQLELNTSKKNE